MFGVGEPITINSSTWMNSQTHLTNINPVSRGLTMRATSHSHIKAVVTVICYGNDTINASPFSNNNHAILTQNSGGSWYSSIMGNLGSQIVGMGSNAKLFLDNVNIRNNQNNTGTNISRVFYCGTKWSVLILNDLALSDGSLHFFRWNDVPEEVPYRGTKLGCVAMFTQSLATSELASITNWGFQRFNRLLKSTIIAWSTSAKR
jgi:hypothetical protein